MTSCLTETAAAGAKRRAHRELAATSHAARHQQSGKIHARDDEHGRHDRHQQPQCRTPFPDEILVQPGHEHAHTFVERILTCERRGDDGHFGPDGVEADTGLQPSVALERARPDCPGFAGIDGQRRVRVRLHRRRFEVPAARRRRS